MGDVSDGPGSDGAGAGARSNASAVVMALAMMALGAFVSYDSVTGLTGPGYAQVGPGVFPVIVGMALLLAGIGLLAQAIRGQWRVAWMECDDTSSAHSHQRSTLLRNVMLIAAALTLNILLFAPLGFIAASTVLFACVSFAFGSRRFVLDTAIGIAFAATIYLVFAHGLGLQLPAGGLWEGISWTP